jgi:GNAT superfamily N-acetyltransferase
VSQLRIVPLARAHEIEQFTTGVGELDRWLRRFAVMAEAAGTARTYVLAEKARVLGYYALAAASVRPEELPARQATGVPDPVAVILLARLAVASEVQGRGYGSALSADAAQRAVAGAEMIGARALIVHASDERAAAFYEQFGFVASPTDVLHLAVLMKDLRKTFGA